VGLGVGVGEGVGVGVGIGEGVGLGLAVGVALAVALGVLLGLAENEALGEADGLDETDALADALGEALGLGLSVGAGTGADAMFCGLGPARVVKSTRFRSVSWPDPALPPGSRSRLLPAGGAGAGGVSSQVLVAVPQPTASTAVAAPCTRSATLPPAAASPFA
jgi:hypothetical protein